MFIGHIWTEHNVDTEESLRNLEREFLLATEKEGHQNQNIYIVSAAEVKVLLDRRISDFIARLQRDYKIKVKIVSAACTSVHAALLDFNQSDFKSAFIFVLELNREIQQGCLNSLGIGNEKEQDGLQVTPGVGLVHVSKETNSSGLYISGCEILSQEIGISGTTKLLSNIIGRLNNISKKAKCVSFDIRSDWCKSLMCGLEVSKCKHPVESWLPSVEENEAHFLSLKPILEIEKYRSLIKLDPIFIMTLGGGGRVGCLLIYDNDNRKIEKLDCREPDLLASKTNFDLRSDYEKYRHALAAKSKSDYYLGVSQALKYPQKQYRGMTNHYFEWNMSSAVFR